MKFKHKLILAFTFIIVTTIVPLVFILNDRISTIGKERILANIMTAEETFKSVYEQRRSFFSNSVDSLVQTDPQLRAVLGSLSSDSNEEDLFGEEESGENSLEQLDKAYERLKSSLAFTPIYKENEQFAVLDFSGKLIFRKQRKGKVGDKIVADDVLAYMREGKSYFGWVLEDKKTKKMHEIFLKPLILNQVDLKGFIYVGKSFGGPELTELKNITNVDLVLTKKEDLLHTTLSKKKLDNYLNKNEEFITRKINLMNSNKSIDGQITIVRSLYEEIKHYEEIKKILFLIAIIVTCFGVCFALVISGKVTSSLETLKKILKNVKEGNLEDKAKIETNDEFKQLADTVNEMIEGLKDGKVVKKLFGTYVDKDIAEKILENKENIKLGGEKKNICVFFSDLADFTTISEKLSPEETITFLNKYLSRMTDIVKKHNGVVDNYIGDAILAYWEMADLDDGQACLRAIDTSLEQCEEMKSLRDEYAEHPILKNIDLRIGLHCGPVVEGNVGSKDRMSHTIIGDTVNLAARLEALNKSYQTKVLISENIHKNISSSVAAREVDRVKVKGKDIPVAIYELFLNDSTYSEQFLSVFNEAQKAYRAGAMNEALNLFNSLKEDNVSKVFVSRCEHFLSYPELLDDSWDGVFKFTIK